MRGGWAVGSDKINNKTLKIKNHLKNNRLFQLAEKVGVRVFRQLSIPAVNLFIGNVESKNRYVRDCSYVTSKNKDIPIYQTYRYGIKAGWKMFPGLNELNELDKKGRLTESEKNFLRDARGYRTVTVPETEAISVAKKAINKNSDLFILSDSISGNLPPLKPERTELNQAISLFEKRHRRMFNYLSSLIDLHMPAGSSVLEIGYTTGGHSIFAFEKMGFKATGVDNFYGGIMQEKTLHKNCAQLIQSKVTFEIGDITKKTKMPKSSFDIIYSASVLEHIQDLKRAFLEMHRLLKPGGAMVHNYHPYFSHNGGHALGIGDSPWVHVRLPQKEYLRYLKILRPHEFKIASTWIQNALHRDMPQSKIQKLLIDTGFRIMLWSSKPSPQNWLADLTADIARDCFQSCPGIGIQDLISQSVSFVAKKI